MDLIRKYGGYLLVLAAGLFIGYLVAGGSDDPMDHQHAATNEEALAYTCAMHPQIQQAETGSCPLCGMDLTAIKTAGRALAANQFQMTENAMALANIETTRIGIGDIEGNTLVLSGKITSNEQTDAVQTSVFDGRIEELDVNYVGQYIKKGKKLGVIYAPELYAAQDKLLTSASYKDTHDKLYAAARNTLGLWKMNDAQIDQLLKTGKPIMNFPIIADVSGTVTEVMASEGNFYKQGDPLFKVSNLYTVWAVFDAYENQLPVLRVGQEIRISSEAFKGRAFTAKIAFIDPVLDASKRTVAVRATLINKDGFLKPGMFVEGIVKAANFDQVLTVPKSAVLWTGKRSLVYVKPDPRQPTFEMVEVTLGNTIGDSYIVLDGLTSGDEVVTNGTFTVDAAAQLQGKKSMMSSKESMPVMEGSEMAMNFNGDFENRFSLIINRYTGLKDALVASDASKAVEHAKSMEQALSQLEDAMLEEILRTHLRKIKEQVQRISNGADLEQQRIAFKPLSEHMVAIASNFSDLDQPIYVQFCPMADNNQGATWLSFQDQIRNPYFGDKMLGCGSITKTIQ
ncbi:efflux RND transporter periplasmic adaptor subunit [Flavobacteriaceae bacterium TP-CH-4]|uniref:Efflux RND transporter periplasmic adaptor subunit n=1 Tax=Pelagihabitans pacificus TaxID=2696054 RepID=A0A967AW19_9FLAO|nr:efflux RND transporter periplasmic adaptor subunit [Pelagihabitans pacificus]NHF60982.1 efflux RND transporter periplasmic adaptor subunit [Pelagihabitans pacificus]